jgi:two-component system phosphate regulon sensor histidine kinase PhoR
MVHRILSHVRHLKRASIEHERLTSLINSMGDGVITVSANMNIVLSNGAALNILDVNDTLINKPLHEVFRPSDKNNQPVPIEQLVESSKIPTTTRDLLLKYPDGSQINLYLSIAPVRLGYGNKGTRGWVLLIRDITHEKSLEEERDEFISVVSHELRTPIAITEGNISNAQFIAEKTGDITQIKHALQQAHDQVMFLASMVNDLATLSRAERGKLVVQVETIDVSKLIASLAKLYESDATKKGLTLETKAPEGLILQSSDLYVREILQNFITNAIKYTDEGGVTVTAEATDKGIRFKVSDTGIGISQQDQDRVFDKFFRSEDFRTRKASGTGLGLYVTLKLTRLIHAEIDVQSELNKGSTFSIFIPNLQ